MRETYHEKFGSSYINPPGYDSIARTEPHDAKEFLDTPVDPLEKLAEEIEKGLYEEYRQKAGPNARIRTYVRPLKPEERILIKQAERDALRGMR